MRGFDEMSCALTILNVRTITKSSRRCGGDPERRREAIDSEIGGLGG
jgi:hypothetical protein